jgi:ABC-type nitrate/sulfonate/bicarbonate transport system permease component
MSTAFSRIRDILAPLALVVLVLIGWQAAVHLFQIQAYVLPAPTRIAQALISDGRRIIFPQLGITLFEILSGFALAIVVAFVLSVLIVYSNAFRRGVLPLIVASQTIPVIAIAPVLVIWFGYNSIPRIMITAIVAFFPLTVAVVTGLQAVDPLQLAFFKTLKATPLQTFFKLRFPIALPNIFAGLKVAATLAVVGATISEWVGASRGLGYLIAQDTQQLNTARVFASLVVLGFCGMALFGVVSLAQRLCMPWARARLRIRRQKERIPVPREAAVSAPSATAGAGVEARGNTNGRQLTPAGS